MSADCRYKRRTPAEINVTQVALAVAALTLSLAVMDPVRASATDGVKPGTGGSGTSATGGDGGNGGGQGGAPGGGDARTNASNGNGGGGASHSLGSATGGGVVGQTISADLVLSTSRQGGNGLSGTVIRTNPGKNLFNGVSGGGGGAGAFVNGARNVTVNTGVTLFGGNGGDGNAGRPGCTGCSKGGAGGGGDGIIMAAGATLNNFGQIQGGMGGAGAAGAANSGSSGGGGGGHGVEGASVTIVNGGIIRGGNGGAGAGGSRAGERGAAIHWTGGTNSLRLQTGSVIDGAIWVGSGATATISADNTVGALSNWLLLDGSATISTATQPITYSGTITGAGSLGKASAGTLILSGTNSFSSGLNIQAGEVQAQLVSLGTGAIRDDGVLRLNPTADGTLTQALTGTGSLIKEGARQLTLNGNVQLGGSAQISGGTLAVGSSGTLTAGSVQLSTSGATLDLSATTHATTIPALSGVAGTTIRTASQALFVGDASNQIYAGTVTGSGRLSKEGSGSLTLTGTNTYAGGTVISAGTLVGSSASFGANAIVDNAALVVNQTANGSMGNAISGTGSLTKQGAGTLTLSGTNSYTGGTTIGAGTVAGSATSFGSGEIVDNASLVLNQASAATFGNVVSGTGSLTKQGAGALTLSGTNTYAGGTTINAGTLVGSAASFGGGAILDNDRLRVDQAINADWLNIVSGSGHVEKTGAGQLTLQQTLGASGGLDVLDGRVIATDPGQLGDGAVTVSGSGQFALHLATDTQLRHIGGDGLIAVDLGDTLHRLTRSTAPSGALAFTGTLALSNASLALSGPGTESLSAVSLRMDSGGQLIAGPDAGSIGSLQMNGGMVRFTPATAEDLSTLHPLQVNKTLDLSGTGTVLVDADLHGSKAADSMGSLMVRDDGVSFQLARPAPGAQVLGDASGLGLAGSDGQPVGDTTDGELVQDGQRVATTVSRYRLSSGASQDGLYLTGRLLGVDVLAGRQLVLSAPADASGAARDLSAPISGAGGLAVDAGVGGVISLSGQDNTYGGNTRLLSGTLALAGGNLPDGSVITFTGADAGLDLGSAGRPQRLGGLDGSASTNTLQLGAQTLTLDTVGDHAFAGAIAGTGGLVKTGAGTQTLSGINTYTGGTTVNAGTLVGSTDSFGSGGISNNGTLVLDQSTDGTLANPISGSGALVKQGTGAVTLTGTNSYAGGTTVSGGTVLGSADSFGNGAVRNDATLVVDQAVDGELRNDLSGSGSFVKRGVGTLTLDGSNTSSGPLRIDAGTLRASVDQLGSGPIINNATLALDVPRAALLDSRLNGSGQVVKSGAGDLTLEGSQAAGSFSVREGGSSSAPPRKAAPCSTAMSMSPPAPGY
ncbi:autotransporter-associated beta strand repeat-containing protein [Roseateles chitinivorans]|uniref:autotransporter-associated beta strand repeat-containing protein n=1 Tax=Roseateles chitinivorans TaxID=2917965 RepID=UPI003D665D65